MSKFVAIVLIGLVGIVAANDDLENETGLLMGNEKVFTDFCMATRGYVVGDFRAKASETSSMIFNAFFGAATEIADEVLKVEKEAVEELSKKIAAGEDIKRPAGTEAANNKNNDVEEEDQEEPLSEDQVRELIEDGKRALEQASGPSSGASKVIGRLVASTMTAAQVMINAANTALFVRLGKLRPLMSRANLIEGVEHICQQVGQYEEKLEADLVEAKKTLKAENSEPELQTLIEKMTVPSLKCHTTKFISRVNAFCEIFQRGRAAFFKMLGL